MEGNRKIVIGIVVFALLAVILTAGYGWFVIATSGRNDVPQTLRYLAAVAYVTFGGVAGMGLYVRIREYRKGKK